MDPIDLARVLRDKGDVPLACPRCFREDTCPWSLWHGRPDGVCCFCDRCWRHENHIVPLTEVDKGGDA